MTKKSKTAVQDSSTGLTVEDIAANAIDADADADADAAAADASNATSQVADGGHEADVAPNEGSKRREEGGDGKFANKESRK